MRVVYHPDEVYSADLRLRSRHHDLATRFGFVCTPHPPRLLSPPERRWCLETRRPGNGWEPVPFNMSVIWRYRGRLHPDLLQRAAEKIVARHAILGCTLEFVAGGWRFCANKAPPVAVRELTAIDSNAECAAMSAVGEHVFREFDFAIEGPLRVGYARVGSDDYIIVVAFHHSFADAYSKRILSYELAAFYDCLGKGTEPQLTALPLTFFDYMWSMEEWKRGPRAKEVAEFWMRRIEGAVPLIHSRAEQLTVRLFHLPESVSARIRSLCDTLKIGAHVFWEAVHHLALRQLLGIGDIVTLSVDGGRRHPELAGVVGQFINLYPTRSQLSDRHTLLDAVEQLRAANRETSAYRMLPYDSIAERCPFEYAASFGQLNFIPRHFFALPAFGPLIPGAIPAGIRAGFIYPYAISVGDEPAFRVLCTGHIRTPFTTLDLCEALERVATECASDPYRVPRYVSKNRRITSHASRVSGTSGSTNG